MQLGEELLEHAVTLKGRSGVTVVEAAVVGGHNLVARLEHLGVDKTLDALLEEVLLVNRLHAGLGNLEHDAPVRALGNLVACGSATICELHSGELLGGHWLVVGGVVGEDGCAVEGAVILGEVEPALVADTLWAVATDTDTNDVGGAVEETLGQADELLVAHGLSKEIDRHGADQLLVLDRGAVLERDLLGVGVDLGDGAMLTESAIVLGQSVGNGNPDATGAANGREAEGGVGAPVACSLVEDDVGDDLLDIRSSDTLTEPLALHLSGGYSPHLVVVGTHEDVGNASAHHSDDPLVKVLGLGACNSVLDGSVNHAVQALDLVLLGQHGDVVLEGVGHPETLAADVGDSLVGVPVRLLGERLVDAVIEVLVV